MTSERLAVFGLMKVLRDSDIIVPDKCIYFVYIYKCIRSSERSYLALSHACRFSQGLGRQC